MKDRSPALLFRSEIEQERAPWVDLTRWRRRREWPLFAHSRRL